MTGSCFIVFGGGWGCSNDTVFDVERDLMTDDNGQRVSKQTNILRVRNLFTAKGEIQKEFLVDCVFKIDDTDTLQGFRGTVAGILKDVMVIKLIATNEYISEILKQIKEDI